MNWIQILAGPAIGAVIGYCTNYVAVKMLFRPLNPIRIGKFTLPFTPGVIPKRNKELAKVVGAAVEKSLLGKDDLKKVLLDDETGHKVALGIADAAEGYMDCSVKNLMSEFVEEEEYTRKKEELAEVLTTKVTEGLLRMDVGSIVAEEGAAAVKQRVAGTMLAMFVKDEMISQIAGMIGGKIAEYIQTDGQEKIKLLAAQELDELEEKNIRKLADGIGITKNVISILAEKIYRETVNSRADDIVSMFPIAEIVEEKINGMDAAELEALVLSVMKNELGVVVNLGALIGFVIGFLNMLF